MTKANKMFEELGYEKQEDKYRIEYYLKQNYTTFNVIKRIRFYKIEKDVCMEQWNMAEGIQISMNLCMQELQAINEKVKELRLVMKKEWKEIKGYEGKYIISNYGEIISLPRYKENKRKMQYVEPREICKYVNKKNGYVYVQLWNNAEYKNIRLHRLVAEHFIEKVEGKEQINHIDGNKQNNRADNLEWCTCRENIQHAYKTGLR